MEAVRKVSRQWSLGSRQWSLGSRQTTLSGKWRLSFGRQSSLDPNKNKATVDVDLCVPEQLDATMQMLFLTCRGDAEGVEALLNHHHPPLDVNSADFDDRTALHVAACQGHAHLVHLLISRGANVNARDRWGSTPLADAKYYGNTEICNILKSNGAKSPKTPMSVANPLHVPEYELNPVELSFPKTADPSKDSYQLAKWNGTKVAVKILDKHYCSDSESMKSFRNELTLLQKIRHPNVVQFIGAVTQNVPMMIIAEYLPNVSEPLVRVLRFVDGDQNPMRYLYEAMDKAKETIQHLYGSNKTKYEPIWRIIDRWWNRQLHQHIHAVAYYLNPKFIFSPSFKVDAEVMLGLNTCIDRLVANDNLRGLILDEIQSYKRAEGALFSSNFCIRRRATLHPNLWWEDYGATTPNLQRLAIQILCQPCSASGCERNWSVFEAIHTKKRNRLTQKRLNDFVYVWYNLQLHENKVQGKDTHDALDLDDIDPFSDWIAEPEDVDMDPLLTDDNFADLEREAVEWQANVAAYEEGEVGEQLEEGAHMQSSTL